jgi:hypothetical protein
LDQGSESERAGSDAHHGMGSIAMAKKAVVSKEGAEAIAEFVRRTEQIDVIDPVARAVIEQHYPHLAGKLPRGGRAVLDKRKYKKPSKKRAKKQT